MNGGIISNIEPQLYDKFKRIKCFVLDVDGVLTNSQLLLSEDGQLLRSMNTRDGLAIKLAIDRGYHVAVVTGGNSQGVVKRLSALGVQDIYSGVSDKLSIVQTLLQRIEIDAQNLLFIGDDIIDLECLNLAGIAACPQDAVTDVIEIADYISPFNGGQGCVRDVIEKVLKLNNHWYLNASTDKPGV